MSVCQARWPQAGQRPRTRGRPDAFHRMPPRSQTDSAWPQPSQRIIHERDSASMLAAQRAGKTAVKNRCTRVTVPMV